MALRDQFLRRWQILRVLEGGGSWTPAELLDQIAADAGPAPKEKSPRLWSPRTLQRDLSHLGRAGLPVEGMRKGRKMRYCLTEDYLASVPGPFRPSQWAALYYGLSTMREMPGSPLRDSPLGPSISGLFARLRDIVPPALRAYADAINGRYAGVIGSLREQNRLRRIAGALGKAIEGRRPVRLLAAGATGHRRRWSRVDPYLVRFSGGRFYLLGSGSASGRIGIWPLDGIGSVRAVRGAFQMPLGMNLESALEERVRQRQGADTEVRVRFAASAAVPAIAAYLEEAFGPARVVRLPGRRAREVVVRVADMAGFRRWLLAFGAEAEIVSPKEVRQKMAQELESALKRYRRSGRKSSRSGSA